MQQAEELAAEESYEQRTYRQDSYESPDHGQQMIMYEEPRQEPHGDYYAEAEHDDVCDAG